VFDWKRKKEIHCNNSRVKTRSLRKKCSLRILHKITARLSLTSNTSSGSTDKISQSYFKQSLPS